MNLIQYFSENHGQLFFLIAGVCFMIELTVMGMSSPILFFAIASFLTAILSSLGIITGWELELFSLGLLTAIVAGILWKPLKSFQNRGDGTDNSSDMIGLSVPCTIEVTETDGAIKYSGINWKARLDKQQSEVISAGTMCKITAVEGNVMIVKSNR